MFSRLANTKTKDSTAQIANNSAAVIEPSKAPEPKKTSAPPKDSHAEKAERAASRYTDLKVQMHQKLLDIINLSAIDKMPPEQFRAEIGDMVRDLIKEEGTPLNMNEQNQLVSDILDELLGLGPLEPLIKDPTVSDILVNTSDLVFVERKGRLELTPVTFKDNRHLLRIIGKIVSAVGRRIDESQPMVDARLADGSRVNAIIPPLAVDGPLMSIRKFATEAIDIEKLVGYGSVPQEAADLLMAIVKARRNVLISGGTGSGKTTMLNAMSAAIDLRCSDEDGRTSRRSARSHPLHAAPRISVSPGSSTRLQHRLECSQAPPAVGLHRVRRNRQCLGDLRLGQLVVKAENQAVPLPV